MTTSSLDIDVLEQLLSQRHSCRAYKPDCVPDAVIERILNAAQRTASWCNSQPWQVVVTRGDGTRHLRDNLQIALREQTPPNPDLPFPKEYQGVYNERRRESGFRLYDAVGIARGDKAAYSRQSARNFSFFDAPHLAVITSDDALGTYGAVDCGAYIATFMLAAKAMGVAAIAQAALAMHSSVLKNTLKISAERRVVCGISFGYANEAHPANSFRTTRATLAEAVKFVDD